MDDVTAPANDKFEENMFANSSYLYISMHLRPEVPGGADQDRERGELRSKQAA